MNLTKTQQLALIKATPENDYCYMCHQKTMKALVDRNLATYSSGFGFKFGAFIELTEEGKELRKTLIINI